MAFPYTMEEVEVVPRSFIWEARKYRQRWMMGWIVALLAISACFYVYGLYDGRKESLRENQKLAEHIRETAELQSKETIAFIDAWTDVRNVAGVNIAWAEWVQEREKLVEYNRARVVERSKR